MRVALDDEEICAACEIFIRGKLGIGKESDVNVDYCGDPIEAFIVPNKTERAPAKSKRKRK